MHDFEHYSYHALCRLRIFFKQMGLYEISLKFFLIIYLLYKQSLFTVEKSEYRNFHEGKKAVVLSLGWMYFDFFPVYFFFQKYGYTHLSAGELLRDERKNPDSQYGELIEKYIKDGKIVPVEITISLLRRVRSVNANQFKPTRKWEIKSALPLSNEKVRVLNFLLVEGGHGIWEWQNWKFHFHLGRNWTVGNILYLGLGSATTQHSYVRTWPFPVCRQSILLLFLFLLPFLLLFSPLLLSLFYFLPSFLSFPLPLLPMTLPLLPLSQLWCFLFWYIHHHLQCKIRD